MSSPQIFGFRCAFVGAFDPRPWAGTAVLSHNGVSVTIPADATPFLDITTFLNGRGCGNSMQTHLTARKTGASTWTIGIDSAGYVYIESSTDDFTMTAGTGLDAWGFSAAGHGLVGGGAPYRRTAPSGYRRGACGSGEYINVTPASSAAFRFPALGESLLWQDPAQSLVAAGSDPYDNTQGTPGTNDLSSLHRAARASGNIVWIVDDRGHVAASWPSALAGSSITWLSDSFRRALGFRGYEPAIASSSVRVMTALDPCPGVLVPYRPPTRITSHADGVQFSQRTATGAMVSAKVASWNTHRVEVHLSGPVDDGSDYVDAHQHFVRRCLGDWHDGARVTLYQEWGDSRYARDSLEGDATHTGYVTPQDNGRRGRRRCFIQKRPASVGFEGALELRTAPVIFDLDEEAV